MRPAQPGHEGRCLHRFVVSNAPTNRVSQGGQKAAHYHLNCCSFITKWSSMYPELPLWLRVRLLLESKRLTSWTFPAFFYYFTRSPWIVASPVIRLPKKLLFRSQTTYRQHTATRRERKGAYHAKSLLASAIFPAMLRPLTHRAVHSAQVEQRRA